MNQEKIHSEAEKIDLEKRLRDSVARTLDELVGAWEARPATLAPDQAVRLQEAIAQAEQLKEKLDAFIATGCRSSPEEGPAGQ